MMRAYELMVIIDGDVEDTEAQAWVKSSPTRSPKPVARFTASPIGGDARQYAYPINKKEDGYYVVYQLRGPGGALDELERSFRIADDIVRHKLIRLPDAEAARRGMAGSRGLSGRSSRKGATMADNSVTLVGNLTRDPELRFTAGGQGVASFGLAVNRRYQVERRMAGEDVVLQRRRAGARSARTPPRRSPRARAIIVTGRLEQRELRDPGGEKRNVVEIVADEIGPSLRWATAQVERTAAHRPGDGGLRRRRRQQLGRRSRRCGGRAPRSGLRRRRAVLTPVDDRIRERPPNDDQQEESRHARPRRSTRSSRRRRASLVTDKVEYVDYKDVNLLSRFVSDRSKIRNRRVTGNTVQQQRDIANAIKNAREMALLPYTKRVSQTRAGRPPVAIATKTASGRAASRRRRRSRARPRPTGRGRLDARGRRRRRRRSTPTTRRVEA